MKNNNTLILAEEILNVLEELNEKNTWINGSKLSKISVNSTGNCITFKSISGQTAQYDISEISYIFKDEIILSDIENKKTIEKKLIELEMQANKL